jgi:histidinol-phosphate aminotransferase
LKTLIKPKEQITGLTPYSPGKPIEEVKREYHLNDVIKLASNENPYGPTPKVKQAIIAELDNLSLYPEGTPFELREAVSAHYQVSTDKIIFGNGADELISLICRTFLNPGDRSVMADITFSEYFTYVVVEGAKAVQVPLTPEGVHDLEAMLAAIDETTKIVWVCNPNNPTGTYVNQDALLRFIERVPHHVLVVVDEAYSEYVTAQDYPQTLKLLDEYPNLIILRTFSKIYALAALRIGYGFASPQVIDWMNRVREPFNTNRLAQKAAVVALEDQNYVKECFKKNKEGKELYYQKLPQIGLKYYPTETNFIMVDLGQEARPIFEAMLRQGVIVRSGDVLGMPSCLRITIGSQEQNERVLSLLAGLVNVKS